MKEKPNIELKNFLDEFSNAGGVLHYVLLQIEEQLPAKELHKLAAITAIGIIDARYYERAKKIAVQAKLPLDNFFRLTWDSNKLDAKKITFSEFWGSDNAKIIKSHLGDKGGVVPNVDGYKTAFFLPPYSLDRTLNAEAVFAQINGLLFGPTPSELEIYEWSTDWSNYFDAGHEWWGAFFWTLRQPDTDWIITIGASSTD